MKQIPARHAGFQRSSGVLSCVAALLLTGCAANVVRQGGATDAAATGSVQVPAASANRVVLNVYGPKVANSADWEQFLGEWRGAFKAEAATRGIAFATQDGVQKPTGEAGTLLDVDVSDYRYLSPGARYGLGVMAGNAYINARIRFMDLANGKVFGEHTISTSSTAWQGIFSAMTEKQVAAIAKDALQTVKPQ